MAFPFAHNRYLPTVPLFQDQRTSSVQSAQLQPHAIVTPTDYSLQSNSSTQEWLKSESGQAALKEASNEFEKTTAGWTEAMQLRVEGNTRQIAAGRVVTYHGRGSDANGFPMVVVRCSMLKDPVLFYPNQVRPMGRGEGNFFPRPGDKVTLTRDVGGAWQKGNAVKFVCTLSHDSNVGWTVLICDLNPKFSLTRKQVVKLSDLE